MCCVCSFDPERLLRSGEVSTGLDWTRPLAIICTATLHHHPGELADIAAVMHTYIDAAAPGSCTVVSHFLDREDATTDTVRRIEKQLLVDQVDAQRARPQRRARLDDARLAFAGVAGGLRLSDTLVARVGGLHRLPFVVRGTRLALD